MITVDLENIIIERLSGELKFHVNTISISISIFSIIIEGTQPGWVMIKLEFSSGLKY